MARMAAIFVLLLVVGGLSWPGFARADPLEVAVQDDGSIVEDWKGRREPALNHAVDLGAKWVRVTLLQQKVARDGWGDYDQAVARIRAHGLKPEVTVTLGPNTPPELWSPNAFGRFVGQVVSRYRGQVARFGLYNEPNITPWFPDMLLEEKAKYYRAFYLTGYRAARAANPSAQILMAELAPSKATNFMRALFCLDRWGEPLGNCEKLITDGFAYHPYQFNAPPTERVGGYAVGIGRLDDITLVLGQAHAAGRVSTPAGASPPLYLNEFGYFSRGEAGRALALTLPDQIRGAWLKQAFKRACETAGVKQLSQYGLYATPPEWPGIWDTSIINGFGQPDYAFQTLRKWIQDNPTCITGSGTPPQATRPPTTPTTTTPAKPATTYPSGGTGGAPGGSGTTGGSGTSGSWTANGSGTLTGGATGGGTTGKRTTGRSGIGGTGAAARLATPKLRLGTSVRRHQPALRRRGVRISLRCTSTCAIRTGTTIAVRGAKRRYKLARITRLLVAKDRVVVELRLTKKARGHLTRALRKRTGLATIIVSARNASGLIDREKRRVRLLR